MARKVIKTAHGPYKLMPQDKEVHICMCGLSKNQPFCDGSHKKTLDEKEDKTYVYADDGSRQECEENKEDGCSCCG